MLNGIKSIFGASSGTKDHWNRSKTTPSTGDDNLDNKIKNWEKFLEQADYDPSISASLMEGWEKEMRKIIDVKASRFQFAVLFGELVREWLSSSGSLAGNEEGEDEDLEHVENLDFEERDRQRKDWEELVFNPMDTDQVAITAYLSSLFGKNGETKLVEKALGKLRTTVWDFEAQMAGPNHFSPTVLRWVIKGLLDVGLLSEEKRGVLRDFQNNQVILTEVADVLNMRIADLDNWSWEAEVIVEQRKHVTGKYHIYMHEDLLQAIFLHYIGVKWSVFFKKALKAFIKCEDVWQAPREEISIADRRKREEYLGPQKKKQSLNWKRQGINMKVFFLSQLMESEYTDLGADADGAEEAEPSEESYRPAVQMARMSAPASVRKQKRASGTGGAKRHRRVEIEAEVDYSDENEDFDNDDDLENEVEVPDSKMQKKQLILRLLAAEILINTKLYGEFSCARSEFKQWGPSLPHSSIYIVLSFLGVGNKWLRFFRRFLEAPLKFNSSTTSDNERPQARKRGVPQSHILSEFFGETLLFCLDYSINQSAPSATLSRLHDDFWVWGRDHNSIVRAWSSVTTFCETMGVSLKPSKSGSVRISHSTNTSLELDKSLPEGDIRWGFLLLDPKTGRFILDHKIIDHHISSLRHQLQDKEKKSVFEWVQAWNTYAGVFFSTNFGEVANCFGGRFVDDILATLSRIQQEVFGDGGSVERWLKAEVGKRFGNILGDGEGGQIPDGWIWFDMKRGGLEVKNMFIPYLQVRGGVEGDLDGVIDRYLEDEKEAYRKAQIAWEKGAKDREAAKFTQGKGMKLFKTEEADTNKEFMSLEEFVKYREDFACEWEGNLKGVFDYLLEKGTRSTVDTVDSGKTAYLDGYWRWVMELYGPEMRERFGWYSVVDQGLLPIGMVELFRGGRVKWQG